MEFILFTIPTAHAGKSMKACLSPILKEVVMFAHDFAIIGILVFMFARIHEDKVPGETDVYVFFVNCVAFCVVYFLLFGLGALISYLLNLS